MPSPSIRNLVVPSPEASCYCVVVIVDVSDNSGEPNDPSFVRVVVGSPGHTEGRLLQGANSSAATKTKEKFCG